MRISKLLKVWLAMVLFQPTVYAYLDPGTGSYIFQLLMAAVFSSFFLIRMYWGKIKGFFKNLFSRKNRQDESNHTKLL